jgi:pyruvate dehydrogenase E2 component (dihydrolipoamide acetyltransferase)
MREFKMPSLGAEMEWGRLIEWKVKVGDRIKKQDIIAIVETDKSAIEIETWEPGLVEKLITQPGQRVPVGTVMALIKEDPPILTPGPPPDSSISNAPSPDISSAKLSFTNSPLAKLPLAESSDKEKRQSVIANAMSLSKREIPHYYLQKEIDLRAALEWLERRNRQLSVDKRLIPSILLMKAVARSAWEHSDFNGFWREGEYRPSPEVHLGIVISLRTGGLVAPALLKADKLSLDEMMSSLTDLVTRARTGRLRSSEVSEASITITNLGDTGADSVFGVIYPPQVAILGFGRISSYQKVVTTLSGDHRVSDGHRGSHFLNSIQHWLHRPEDL